MKILSADEAKATILRRKSASQIELTPASRARLAEVIGFEGSAVEMVQRIIDEVRDNGDAALKRFTAAFDNAELGEIEVPRDEIEAALKGLDAELRQALEFAATRIRRYHEAQLKHCVSSFMQDGLGVQVRALETVGFYAPGSAPAYPSSVLHTVIPARVAGVSNVVLVSPPSRDGKVPQVKLAAAAIAGVDRVFIASGAQAVAALAYGTETIPRVDKIVGPGNIFVTIAKRAVFGDVGIDSIYGPTETVIVADDSADAGLCAADLIAQAEHDELASPIFITDSREFAESVAAGLEQRLAVLPRESIARTAFETQGGVIVAHSIEAAVELGSDYGPEHLCIIARDARRLAGLVKNAGGIFLGEGSPEAIGDYTAGPSHVMPTGGAARFASPLSVQDFLKFSTIVDLSADGVFELGPPGARIAHAEGLVGHARAIEERLPQ